MTEITNFRGETTPNSARDQAEAEVADLIARVGERVRAARQRRGIPRRVLSEISGVSPRYLAQLEAGEGNISIGLLQRVATALDHRIEWLVGEDDPWSSDAMRVADLYRVAGMDTRAEVLRLLSPAPSLAARAGRICLVGLRGAGKSTLGQRLGAALGLPFVELNDEIEDQAGMPVAEVMALYGQEGYRKLEAQAVARIVATHDALVLAVAGGIVAEPETYKTLLAHFHTVWLRASPIEHMERVRAQGDERPMAGNPEAMEELRSILTSREALYGRAEAQIDTSGQSVEASLSQLTRLVRERGYLD
ncbi:helix-turn-helix transcriptional regulator [Ruegeria pomeroyi]|uniref:Shikimate kinase n=2 Tax=Ruegeria pomeroyi TaxID=89184 RepID=Q5LM60_RUEPO|nr:helix-turn-helix transcriptional regulator [Ruegeria pomeroyi]HCE71518.1 helix-turn-helix domain-containing protein [Ruegeria sp.]AAV96925.1 DNA-binding/shikimate kinase domain protein [Ruegeria pomeroyi DSS-3]NVK97906.1 helix-turn-helix transcriptional regulator [Ruegeria pomeroyi]NVL02408.1 helix-turn-helix transcriptional regulator [Ruegeria pomeroyi]QWV10453.1 helix-turn-helix transcriptional regulator [Ruegeria pomeroyi]